MLQTLPFIIIKLKLLQVEIKRAEPRDGRSGVMGRQSGWGTMVRDF